MIGIQILAILFAFWMLYFTYLHYRRREFRQVEATVWALLWLGLIAVVVYPKSVNFILTTFRINRTFDFVVIVGIIVLYAVSFRNSVNLRRLERRFEDDVRSEALSRDEHQRE